MTKIKKTVTPKVGEDTEQPECSYTVGKMTQPLWRTVWQFLMRLNTCPSSGWAIPLWGTLPRQIRRYIHKRLVYRCSKQSGHKSHKLETTWMSVNKWMDKHNGQHPHSGPLLSNKKQWTPATSNDIDVLKTLCWAKEARYKSVPAIRFHWHNSKTSQKKYNDRNQIVVMVSRGGRRTFLGWWKCFITSFRQWLHRWAQQSTLIYLAT